MCEYTHIDRCEDRHGLNEVMLLGENCTAQESQASQQSPSASKGSLLLTPETMQAIHCP